MPSEIPRIQVRKPASNANAMPIQEGTFTPAELRDRSALTPERVERRLCAIEKLMEAQLPLLSETVALQRETLASLQENLRSAREVIEATTKNTKDLLDALKPIQLDPLPEELKL